MAIENSRSLGGGDRAAGISETVPLLGAESFVGWVGLLAATELEA